MRGRLLFASISALAVALGCASCSFMPGSGPESFDIRAGQINDPNHLPYALVKVTPQVIDLLAQNSPRLTGAFGDRRVPGEIRFGLGDVVGVTIFEAAAGGLFIPSEAGVRPGNFIALPNQQVDSNGNISVPYAGSIRAKGRTPVEVQQEIVDAVKNRAIEPQVVVSLVEQRTSLISVLGEVNSPARFPASPAGERILDAITRAGGPKGQGFDTWVMLERDGRRAVVPFGLLVYEPSNNIYVHPNDTLFVYREPQTFIVFGANAGSLSATASGTVLTGGSPIGIAGGNAQGVYSFDAWRLSLAEAVAKGGGLNDLQADASSVFLYRGETRQVAKALGVDPARFVDGPIIPVIYEINFRDPAAYFLATRFQMRNKDVIYIANAAAVESAKVFDYLRLIVGTVNDPIVAATNAYVLKAAINGTFPTGSAVAATP
jgi:polysaccharide export outer membrane protein